MEGVAVEGAGQLLTYGPLGVAVALLLYYISGLHKERRDTEQAHKVEIAAERKLNGDLHEARLADQKVLIELAQFLRTSIEAQSSKEEQNSLKELSEAVQKLVEAQPKGGN